MIVLAFYPGTYFVKAEQHGCQTSGATEVRLSPDCCTEDKIKIPNAFSPNGDGQNDTFFIKDDSNIIEYLELKIFNRWGRKYFKLQINRKLGMVTFKKIIEHSSFRLPFKH